MRNQEVGIVVLYFTTENLTARMERATAQTADAGLTGLPVTPGPDQVGGLAR